MQALKSSILFINGSASSPSSNDRLIRLIMSKMDSAYELVLFDQLKALPHFDPQLSSEAPPAEVVAFRQMVSQASGVVICTPEYIFSIPSGLKNALEWCVATTIFEHKPLALVTASAHGAKGHEELQLIMKTLSADFTPETLLLIQGIKGKVNESGVHHQPTADALDRLSVHFMSLVRRKTENRDMVV